MSINMLLLKGNSNASENVSPALKGYTSFQGHVVEWECGLELAGEALSQRLALLFQPRGSTLCAGPWCSDL